MLPESVSWRGPRALPSISCPSCVVIEPDDSLAVAAASVSLKSQGLKGQIDCDSVTSTQSACQAEPLSDTPHRR
jgi:hypothetical protein